MLETKNLTLHYGGSQILYGIDMAAETGQITCVMGTNGVGKTSLLKALSGTHHRSGGEVVLNGEGLGKPPAHVLAHKGVGYVPQGRMIFPLLTVKENMETAYACLPRAEHMVPGEIYELFPVLKEMQHRRGGDLRGQDLKTGATHPVVIRHPHTGQKLIYVNPGFTINFVGQTREESLPLLQELFAHAMSPTLQCRLQWEPGTVAIWDNRTTWHYAMNDYQGYAREMHRITLSGEALAA